MVTGGECGLLNGCPAYTFDENCGNDNYSTANHRSTSWINSSVMLTSITSQNILIALQSLLEFAR
jgi:hypothetical protein